VRASLGAYTAGDVLSVAHQGSGPGQIEVSGATVAYGGSSIGTISGGNGADLVVALSSSATAQAVQALLAQLRYASTSADPTAGGTATTRALTVSVGDGGNTGAGGARTVSVSGTITVTARAGAPVISGAGSTRGYAEQAAAVTLEPALTLSDADDTQIASATVAIAAGLTAGDTLSWTDQPGIVAGYNAATGVLSLSGTASLAAYEALLRTVAYASGSDDPAAGSASRTIGWSVTDANASGTGAATG
jgi:hypothetical protein